LVHYDVEEMHGTRHSISRASKKWKVASSSKTGSTLAIIEGKGDHTDAANESINFNCRYYNATLLSVCQCTLVKELVTHSLTNIGTL